ncbi:Y-family DNA polymerase [Cytophagaceae bacterium DM2B3-1]|uniref:Y-family DNA polymerase n=1 Tax=Xanthocytophaga flava TaxID=3048013 RepID=A0ABT7CP57_9BACT|nr:Y-family DNA polymerase [Xanthocytophaga flavus]MDJ1494767.1 Y-family DNA polymerase [Xanthocytophaga flavus]
MFGLIDANNFYVSCERVFNPALDKRPVVVLSNNDGCIVSRSNEARQLGIKMGAPYFEAKPLLDQHQVAVFSSNYALYGDMSQRLMNLLSTFSDEVEIYSVDECFVGLEGFERWNLLDYGRQIRETVLLHLGLPTCVGIAPTKTLAKVANLLAKRHSQKDASTQGVLLLDTEQKWKEALAQLRVEDIWGVGRQYAKKLHSYHITNAADLARVRPAWAKKHLGGMIGERLIAELNGVSCLEMELTPATKKSIVVSRSFGRVVTTESELSEAVSVYASKASEKLRIEKTIASVVTVFIQSSRFKETPFYASISITLPAASSDSRVLVHYALEGLKRIYKEGIEYKKAGILLDGICPAHNQQTNLFDERPSNPALMAVVDKINARWGAGTVFLASNGTAQSWQMLSTMRSNRFTTKWKEIPEVKI